MDALMTKYEKYTERWTDGKQQVQNLPWLRWAKNLCNINYMIYHLQKKSNKNPTWLFAHSNLISQRIYNISTG